MYKGSVSKKVLAALGATAMLAVGCGGAAANEEKAPAQARQAVTSAASPLAAGRYHALLVRADGSVWSWGGNPNGQLGIGSADNNVHSTPTQVQGLTGTFVSVAGCETSSLALRSDGTVWGWGSNAWGQLGDGTYTQRTTPVQVTGLPAGNPVVAISMGALGAHALALLSNGDVYSWGWNGYGQLGRDTAMTTQTTPVQVQVKTADGSAANLTNVVAIAAGSAFSLAVRSDGTLWSWGRNDLGQLGDGTTVNHTKAAQVVLPATSVVTGQPVTAVDVAAGASFGLVRLSDGTVYAFGQNGWGQLGIGTTVDSWTPRRTGSLTGITRIAAGSQHGMAVDASGGLWTWGGAVTGALGWGPTNVWGQSTPGQVSGISGSRVAGGGEFSLAIDTTGSVWAWGYNNYGQTGRSTSAPIGPATVTLP